MNPLRLKQNTRIHSIHRFLVIGILTILTLATAAIGYFNYYEIKQLNRRVFQTQLISSAELLDALTSIKIQEIQARALSRLLKESSKLTISELIDSQDHHAMSHYIRYQDVLSFQVWNLKSNSLIIKSDNAPDEPMSHITFGFSKENIISGEPEWEAFTLTNTQNEVRIIIAARADFHEAVGFDLIIDDLIMLTFIYIILSITALMVIHYSFRHLKRISSVLATRDPSFLEPIDLENVPIEISPLVDEINLLFRRVERTLAREKRFTANAAHELRTPLAALKTHAEVALKAQSLENTRKSLQKAIKGCDRCTHLVSQLLTLSRLEPEDKLAHIASCNLCELIVEMLADLVPLALEKKIELSFDSPDTPITVAGNATTLFILVRNLIDNAIRYTPESGQIKVSLKQTGRHAHFVVQDSGPGVSEEALPQLFDRFYRELGNNQDGSGLGLSIVHHITRLHNGSIEAINRQDASGLEMHLKLPISDEP